MAVSILEEPPLWAFSQNPIVLKVNGTPGAFPNYSVALFVEMEDEAGNFVRIGQAIYMAFDNQGDASADISAMLNAVFEDYYSQQPPVPYPDSFIPVKAPRFRRYRYQFYERYGDPPAFVGDPDYSVERKVFYGEAHPDYAYETFFLAPLQTQMDNFLTDHPTNAHNYRLRAEDRFWLPFFAHATGTYQMLVIVTYTDGSLNILPLDAFTIIELEAGEVGLFPVGIQTLGLDQLDPSKTIRYHTLQVLLQGGSLQSQPRTFYYDARPNPGRTEILYLNRYGVPEIFTSSGFNDDSIRLERSQAVRVLEQNNRRFRTHQSKIETIDLIRLRSGHLTKEKSVYLKQLHTSMFTYLIEGNRFWHIVFLQQNYLLTRKWLDIHVFETDLIRSDWFDALFEFRKIRFQTRSTFPDLDITVNFIGTATPVWVDDQGNYIQSATINVDYSGLPAIVKTVELFLLADKTGAPISFSNLQNKQLSGAVDLSATLLNNLDISGQHSIDEIIWPVGRPITGSINASQNLFPNGISFQGADISGVRGVDFSDCTLSTGQVNRILEEIDRGIPADDISGSIIQMDGNNAAPDDGEGGADGLAAVANLQAKGWTVNHS